VACGMLEGTRGVPRPPALSPGLPAEQCESSCVNRQIGQTLHPERVYVLGLLLAREAVHDRGGAPDLAGQLSNLD